MPQLRRSAARIKKKDESNPLFTDSFSSTFWVAFLDLIAKSSAFTLYHVVQLLSHVRLFGTPWTDYSMPGFPVLHCLPEFCSNSCPLSW